MQRKEFLQLSSLTLLSPITKNFPLGTHLDEQTQQLDEDFLFSMVKSNNLLVAKLLENIDAGKLEFSRKLGNDFSNLAAAYVTPQSAYYHQARLVTAMEQQLKTLLQNQTEDGTVNIGNLESPPDTAFLVELVTAGALLLSKDKSPELHALHASCKTFLTHTGDAIATGGVHTPNHRWVVCAALARLNELYPNKKYLDRIEAWMGEGIFMDEDGHYPERSSLYSHVENNSLITMARLLNKPHLYQYVRKSLNLLYYYMEPNGDLVSNDSRRQDQYKPLSALPYYIHYRYMANLDGNGKMAAIAKQIETIKGYEQNFNYQSLFHLLENPLMLQKMPESKAPEENYTKLIATSHLLRIREKNTTITFFGGIDWPLVVASGRSNSPNFFSFRHGKAILKYLRLSANFFDMGYFYSDGLKKEGNTYVLHKKLEIPYYQPLPKEKRNAKGDYKLSPSIDDRFWNKMDFSNRPVSNVKTMETTIRMTPSKGKVSLHFSIIGLVGVPVTIELGFPETGQLKGITGPDNGNYFLENGTGTYQVEEDTIRFGPGQVASKRIYNLEGERYSTHFGSLKTEGQRVFITGKTPFTYTLTIETNQG